MAPRKGRSPAAGNVTQQSIEQASTALAQLPEKPKTNWSLREAINQLQGTISTALQRGYSYQEVAEMLGEQGIRISPASLKSYLAAGSRDAGEAPKRRRAAAKKTSAEKVATLPEAPTPEATSSAPESAPQAEAFPEAKSASEETPAPKKTRGPRTASKTKAAPTRGRKAAPAKAAPSTRRKKASAASAS